MRSPSFGSRARAPRHGPGAYDHQRDTLVARRGGRRRAIADLVAAHERIVYKRSRDSALALSGHPGQSRAAARDELAPGRDQWLISFQSRSYARTRTWSFSVLGGIGMRAISGGNWNRAGSVATLRKRRPGGRLLGML